MRFGGGGVDEDLRRRTADLRERLEQRRPYALFDPAHIAIVEGFSSARIQAAHRPSGPPDFSTCTMPLITRRSSTRALPRISVGRCGSIFETARPSARTNCDSSSLPFGSRESHLADHANNFMGPEPRFSEKLSTLPKHAYPPKIGAAQHRNRRRIRPLSMRPELEPLSTAGLISAYFFARRTQTNLRTHLRRPTQGGSHP